MSLVAIGAPVPRGPRRRSPECSIAAAAAATAIATSATPTVPAAAATVPAAATAAAGFTGLGLVHGKVPTVMVTVVKALDRRLCLGIRAHLNEPESLGAVGVAIDDDLRTLHGPKGGKQRLEVTLVHVVA